MSLLNKVFGKSEPLNQIGGADALTKSAGKVVHNTTEQLVTRLANYHQGLRRNIIELETVIPITLWSFTLRGFCHHAPLWSPSNPQSFIDQLCLSAVKSECPDDTDHQELMHETLVGLIQEMGKDEEEERMGKIDKQVRIFRAAGRILNPNRFLSIEMSEVRKKFPFVVEHELVVCTLIAGASPWCESLSRKYLEVVQGGR